MKGAVASGHPLTTAAALGILKRGGNAFDAAVAAGFASVVTEPCLTSLGGGGFLLAHDAEANKDILFDFFVDAPGKGNDGSREPVLKPVEVRFKSTAQIFHAGAGSVAVPGTLRGFLKLYDELCTMDIDDVVAPALSYLEEGVEVNEFQGYAMRMLMPILTSTDYGREIYGGKEDRTVFNPLLREFLSLRSPRKWLDAFYGSGAARLEEQMKKGNGLLTALDMREYEVYEREPLRCSYRGYEILGNPPPSFGSTLLVAALKELSRMEISGAAEPDRLLLLSEAMEAMNRMRNGVAGTTQISVMDGKGNAVSMTSSNGTNSGVFLGDTGVMLNNMMGEDDLHPAGFHAMEPGTRVGSMMSPSLIKRGREIRGVLGSGGSKRIKTAMLQAIHNLLDRGMDVRDAVEAPRMHLDDSGVLQMEPGFSGEAVSLVAGRYPLNQWDGKDLYFGGVHAVMAGLAGWGDSRRGGSFGLA